MLLPVSAGAFRDHAAAIAAFPPPAITVPQVQACFFALPPQMQPPLATEDASLEASAAARTWY